MAWIRACTIALALLAVGCFGYVPTAIETVPDGRRVRVWLTPAGADRLADLGVANLAGGEGPAATGALVRRPDGRFALRVPVAPPGPGATDIVQEVLLAPTDVLRVDLERLDRGRTALATTGALGLSAATIVLIVRDASGEPRLPPPGGPDDLRGPPGWSTP